MRKIAGAQIEGGRVGAMNIRYIRSPARAERRGRAPARPQASEQKRQLEARCAHACRAARALAARAAA
eukprot:6180210-Pleurochrysis_carterae.AAC.1